MAVMGGEEEGGGGDFPDEYRTDPNFKELARSSNLLLDHPKTGLVFINFRSNCFQI